MNKFKQTEIGLIPEDWETKRFDELFTIQQGKQVSKKNRIGNNQCDFLRTANVFWGKLELSKLDKMNFTSDEMKKFKLESEDLLVREGGDIGRTAVWRGELENCFYQNHLHRLRRNSNSLSPIFYLFWLMHAFKFSKIYFGRANVTTIPNLSKSRLSELLAPFFDYSEQRKIAYILTTIQRAIEKQEEIIKTTTELKKALMKKLFTEGLNGEKQKETEIGLVPESWEVVELEDICERLSENYLPSPNGNKRYVGLEHIDSGKSNLHRWDYEKKIRSSKTKFKKSNILYGKLRPYLDKAVLTTFDGICSTDILVFTGKKNVQNEYLIYLFHSDKFLEYAKATTSGVQHPRTSWSSLKKIKFGLPKHSERTKITIVLITLENKIEIQNKKKKIFLELFQSLLNQLMTGQKRVNGIDFPNMQ